MRLKALVLLAVPLALVVGCSPTPSPPSDDSPTTSATPKPTETATPVVPLAPDLLLQVTATAQGSATWPSDRRLRLFPTANDDVSLASSGFLVEDSEVDGATSHCARDRYLYGAGTGSLILGSQGDSDEATAAGNVTRWANQIYGFVGQEVAGQTAAEAGITISGCSYVITDAGTQLNGGASWWGEHIDESNCYVGSTSS